MPIDSWLPVGFTLPDGKKTRLPVSEGPSWQILETQGHGRALLALEELAQRWFNTGLVDVGQLGRVEYGDRCLRCLSSAPSQMLCSVAEGRSPDSKVEALSFALALRATRAIDAASPLQDALYVEKLSRLLPTYSISSRTEDDVVLGYWLTGGARVSARSFRRLSQTMSWLGAGHLKEVIEAAGIGVNGVVPSAERPAAATDPVVREEADGPEKRPAFELAGRPALAAFLNEHVIDIVEHRERYKTLGIGFPGAVVLEGPPGCGKTYAVERLIDFLGWPSFAIEAASVASPYIHETSRKVAEVFDKAIQSAPSVLVIDEMEAFLADREVPSGHHRVEEVAEFLRRIPEATNKDVLIVAMTNRVEMIDPAILRRGRFDHVVKVDFATEVEVLSLLRKLLATLPADESVDPQPFAAELAGRPLSDVTFLVREGARLAARAGKDKLDQDSLMIAMKSTPARERDGAHRQIGFV